MRPFFCATFRKKSLTNISKICCSLFVFKLYHKTCEQFYRNFGLYEKSPNSFLPGLSRSIINQFRFHNLLCLCLASVHLPYPLHLVSACSCSVTPFCSASDCTISSMRFRAASSILAQYCLTYTQLSRRASFSAYLRCQEGNVSRTIRMRIIPSSSSARNRSFCR